jgi:hypothetical protein
MHAFGFDLNAGGDDGMDDWQMKCWCIIMIILTTDLSYCLCCS